MKVNYLFPSKYKKIGWLILIPTVIAGLAAVIMGYEPDVLTFNVPSIFNNDFLSDKQYFTITKDNVLNEILGILMVCSSLLVAFSKEKSEDEYITQIRLESLVWAVYLNCVILLFSFIFIFGLSFLWVMTFNMFTVLLFFIIRFNWQIHKLKIPADYEK